MRVTRELHYHPLAPGFAALSCLLAALMLQHVMGWLPCPLCILQRLSLIGLMISLLVWAPKHPTRKYGMLAVLVFCAAGVAGAAAQLHLLMAPQSTTCGPGLALTLNQIVEALPAGAWLLEGAGACDEARYSILGLPLPLYSAVAHIGLGGWAFVIQRRA